MTNDTTKIPSGAPTRNEIKNAIKNFKSNKASGLDILPPEIFQTYSHTIANILEYLQKKKMYGTLAKSQANGNKGSCIFIVRVYVLLVLSMYTYCSFMYS